MGSGRRACGRARAAAHGVGLLLLGATRRWVAIPGLIAALLLAVASARGTGRVPFLAAIGIAAVDIAVFAAGGEALS